MIKRVAITTGGSLMEAVAMIGGHEGEDPKTRATAEDDGSS